MKKISITLLIALICLIIGCEKSQEVDYEGNRHLNVTADINLATKVSFTYDGVNKKLKSFWETPIYDGSVKEKNGDIIFGFWKDKSATIHKLKYEVSSLNSEGRAVFSLVEGVEPTDAGTVVYMIYSGSADDEVNSSGVFDLNIQDQSEAIKSIMLAQESVVDDGGELRINFTFHNQCAIINIKELNSLTDGINKIVVYGSNLITNAKIALDSGDDIIMTPGNQSRNIYLGEKNAVGGKISDVKFAVIPCPATELIITAGKDDTGTKVINSSIFSVKKPSSLLNLSACKYYQVSPVFVKTSSVEYVVLDGKKWTKNDVGTFAWGETTKKSSYWDSNYKFGTKAGDYTKYNSSKDQKTQLDAVDDAASVQYGGLWEIPTIYDYSSLISKCKWTFVNEKYGKNNGLYAKDGTDELYFKQQGGREYWWSSNSWTDYDGRAFFINGSGNPDTVLGARYEGWLVKGVCRY